MPKPWIAPDLTLPGRHIRLVPMEISHVPELFLAGRDQEVWRYVPYQVKTEADMLAYVRTALADRERGDSFAFTILDAEAGKVLGSTRYYSLTPIHRNLEIGYTWLDPAVWRTAVNTEAKFLMLREAFESLGCLRVALRTDMRNLRSQRAMERFGAVREGVFRRHMIMPDGHIRDTVYYSVTDQDWPRVKAFQLDAMERARS